MDEVTATEAAALTGLSERTIRRKILSGEIPARHVAKNRYAIRVRDLPLRKRAGDLELRIEALEHRVRLLELRLARPDDGERPDSLPPAADETHPTDVSQGPQADLELAGADPAAVSALRQALSQILGEITRLSGGATSASGGQSSAAPGLAAGGREATTQPHNSQSR